jgi:hypothetical protein
MIMFSLLHNTTLVPSLRSFRKENAGLLDYYDLCVGVPGFHFWKHLAEFYAIVCALYAIICNFSLVLCN